MRFVEFTDGQCDSGYIANNKIVSIGSQWHYDDDTFTAYVVITDTNGRDHKCARYHDKKSRLNEFKAIVGEKEFEIASEVSKSTDSTTPMVYV